MKERPDLNTNRFNESRFNSESSGDGRSVKQILRDIVNSVSDIIRSEIRLAKTEVRQDVTEYAKTGSLIGSAGLLGLYAVGFVLLSVVYALSTVIASWLAALLVGLGLGIAAAILYFIGRKQLMQVSLRPDKTIQTLGENVTWFKRQTKS